MLASPDQQISLTDPDSRSMDTEHHLIITHEVTNTGSDRSQLAKMAGQAKDALDAEHLDVVADRGYFNSPEILACEQADITVTLRGALVGTRRFELRRTRRSFVSTGQSGGAYRPARAPQAAKPWRSRAG